MKIRITENQYTYLVEQKRDKNFWKNLDWNKVDGLVVEKLNRMNVGIAIKAYRLMFRDGSPSPDINPLPASKLYTDAEGSINSDYQANRWNRKHHGVDLDTTGDVKNQPIVATCAGEVKESKYGGGACGGMVILGCFNGMDVQYCHLDLVIPENVIVGRSVPQGFPLGVSGGANEEYSKSGRSGGAHLHYAIWKPFMEKSLNPHILYPNLFPSKSGQAQPSSMTR